VGVYYIVGNWSEIDHLNWKAVKKPFIDRLKSLKKTSSKWMLPEELSRLSHILELLT
jgi:hypothetical protein